MIRLLIDVVAAPSRALERSRREPDHALPQAAGLYALYLAGSILFYWLKPWDFPPPQSEAGIQGPQGPLFWSKVFAFEPVFLLLLIGLSVFFCRLLKGGSLPKRLALALAAAAAPVVLLLLHTNGLMGRGALGLGSLLLLSALAPSLKDAGAPALRSAGSWLLCMHAVSLALLPAFAAAVALRTAGGYAALEMISLVWTLGLASYGMARIADLSAARAFCAIFISLLCQLLAVFILHFLGLLPSAILKALIPA